MNRVLVAAGALALSAATASEERPLFRAIEGFVDYRNHSGSSDTPSIAEMTGAGVCVIDYDLDGTPDLYFPNGREASNRLFRNHGGLVFSDVTNAAGVDDAGWAGGCAVGDIDNDGDPDLYITNNGPNVLFRNRGDGTFGRVEDVAAHAGYSTGAAFGDLDGDGLLDLYVTSYIDLEQKAPEAGCRYFGLEVFCGPNGLSGQADVLYRGIDGRRFEEVTDAAGVSAPDTRGLSVLVTDLDGDRLPEIRVANDATRDLLFRNRGEMRFDDISLVSGTAYSGSGMEQSGMGSSAGDFDADGDLDVYVTNFQRDYNTLFENVAELRFRDATVARGVGAPTLPFLGWGTHFLDANEDGHLDLFVANGHIYPALVDHPEIREPYSQANQLFLNDGSGKFSETNLGGTPHSSRGTAVVDVNGDDALDVVVNNIDDVPTLYLGRDTRRSLRLSLVGTSTNRDGLGAKLSSENGLRELRGSDGYLGSNELVLHVNLDSDAFVIEWPSGRDDAVEAPAAEGLRIFKEGVGWVR